MQMDIQAAIKCAQKIDQRQIPSDVWRDGMGLVLIFDLNRTTASLESVDSHVLLVLIFC